MTFILILTLPQKIVFQPSAAHENVGKWQPDACWCGVVSGRVSCGQRRGI